MRPEKSQRPGSAASSAGAHSASCQAVDTARRLSRRYLQDRAHLERVVMNRCRSSARVLGCALVLSAFAGCASSSTSSSLPATTAEPSTVPVHAPVGYPSTFLAVTQTPPVIRGDKLYRYASYNLQVRSASGGDLRQTLLRSLGEIDAVVGQDHSIIVAVDYRCRSTIERIAPTAAKTTVVATVPGAVREISLDPTGTELAYLTYPPDAARPCVSPTQPVSPQALRVSAGPAGFNPNVLGVVNLASGAVVATTSTDMPGHPLTDPSWSPDGSRISVGYMGNTDQVLILGSSSPDFATAKRIVAPTGCGFTSPTWTNSGIVAAEGCGAGGPSLSPGALVRLRSDGKIVARWSLPACIDGITTSADASLGHILLQASIGYGNGPPCGIPGPGTNSVLIATVNGSGLNALTNLPSDTEVQAVSW
jgi:hypothetical protein